MRLVSAVVVVALALIAVPQARQQTDDVEIYALALKAVAPGLSQGARLALSDKTLVFARDEFLTQRERTRGAKAETRVRVSEPAKAVPTNLKFQRTDFERGTPGDWPMVLIYTFLGWWCLGSRWIIR